MFPGGCDEAELNAKSHYSEADDLYILFKLHQESYEVLLFSLKP